MKSSRGPIVVTVLSALAVALPTVALDAKTAPLQSERVAFENDRVRVIEYASRPQGGVCGVGAHSHPAHVTIVLAAARDRMTIGKGKPEYADMKVGDVYWSDGETHTDVNVGKTDSRLIVVELK